MSNGRRLCLTGGVFVLLEVSLSYWRCLCLTGCVFVLLDLALSYWRWLCLPGGVFVLFCLNGDAAGGTKIVPPPGKRGALTRRKAVVDEAVVEEAVVEDAAEPPPGLHILAPRAVQQQYIIRQAPTYLIFCAVKATILGHVLAPFGGGLGGH